MSPTVRKFKVAFLLPHLCSEAKTTTFSFLRVPGTAALGWLPFSPAHMPT